MKGYKVCDLKTGDLMKVGGSFFSIIEVKSKNCVRVGFCCPKDVKIEKVI